MSVYVSGMPKVTVAPDRVSVRPGETVNVEVTIHPCGEALCGDVTRVFANNSMESLGAAKVAPPRVGLRILSDLRPDGDGPNVWFRDRVVPLSHAFLNGEARARGTPGME